MAQDSGAIWLSYLHALSDLIVIGTDGSYEQADSLRVACRGVPGTGHDVFRHSLDEVGGGRRVRSRQAGLARAMPPLPGQGQRRPLLAPVPVRHRFASLSVYCVG